jgi:tripartite-type tricarboxylate transporter receptor subunit TctC
MASHADRMSGREKLRRSSSIWVFRNANEVLLNLSNPTPPPGVINTDSPDYGKTQPGGRGLHGTRRSELYRGIPTRLGGATGGKILISSSRPKPANDGNKPMTARSYFRILATAAVLAAAPAQAEDYPSHPVTIMVPFAAGGGSDLLARLVAQHLEQKLGKPFIIENRPGAGTTIAAMATVRAAPDGYTLMQGTSSTMAINVTMYKKLAYEPLKDLIPVALLSASPFILVVSASSPVKTLADLIKLAKEKPNSLNYGSGGPGSMHHLSTELLLSLTGTKMTHVPYKATPPAMNDLLGGNIQVLFGDTTSVLPLVKQGKVRALAVSTTYRSEELPDVPSVAETIPGFDTASWQMLVAPGKTPPDIVAKLNRTVHEIFSEPAVKTELIRRGVGPKVTGSPAELQTWVKSEIVRWGNIVRQAGVAGRL